MSSDTPRTDAQEYYIDGHYHVSAALSRELERENAKLMADKRRLDALDRVLAENAWRASWGWRWSPESEEGSAKLYLTQDGKMLSARAALDVLADSGGAQPILNDRQMNRLDEDARSQRYASELADDAGGKT
jgi:hypothetical protein